MWTVSNFVTCDQCAQCLSGHATERNIFMFFSVNWIQDSLWLPLSVINIILVLRPDKDYAVIKIILRRNNKVKLSFSAIGKKKKATVASTEHLQCCDLGRSILSNMKVPGSIRSLPGRCHQFGDIHSASPSATYRNSRDSEKPNLFLKVSKVHLLKALVYPVLFSKDISTPSALEEREKLQK